MTRVLGVIGHHVSLKVARLKLNIEYSHLNRRIQPVGATQ
jgi:hypothetical protein